MGNKFFNIKLLVIFGLLCSLTVMKAHAQAEDDWWNENPDLFFCPFCGDDCGGGCAVAITATSLEEDPWPELEIEIEDWEDYEDPYDDPDYILEEDDPPYEEPETETEPKTEEQDNEPTPCEDAKLADHVYNTVNGEDIGDPDKDLGSYNPEEWEMNSTLDNPDLILEDPEDDGGSGFNSAIYQRPNNNGGYDYMYVTQGTDIFSTADWENNIEQGLGKPSKQYSISIENAKILAEMAEEEGFNLTFSGHSLGGGMASANALATGYPAVTYNAAGLHPNIKEHYGLYKEADIQAYVVKGEILDVLNKGMGMVAEGNINEINIPGELFLNILAILDPTKVGLNLTIAALKHTMLAVLLALGCN